MYFLYLMDAKGELYHYFTGAGIQHFTGQTLAKYRFPIPRDGELQDHVSRFDALRAQTSALCAAYEGKLGKIVKLRQSILQKAFSGELTSPPSIKEAAE